jgi:tetratricopeptide (TPR) repeat protein
MAMADWFRCTDWNERTEAEFFRRLKRARTQKPQYLLIQALTLVQTGRPEFAETALNLIHLFEDEYSEDFFVTNAFDVKAHALTLLERWEDAFQAFEDALSARRARPNVTNDVWLEYPLCIARRRERDRYQRALEILKEFASPQDLLFPVSQFKYFATVALISADQGDREGAVRWARNALAAVSKPAPFTRHPGVGLVGPRYADLQIELEHLVAGL